MRDRGIFKIFNEKSMKNDKQKQAIDVKNHSKKRKDAKC